MAVQWDREVDVLVAGSGAAGMTAAVTAADLGLSVLVAESTERWAGRRCARAEASGSPTIR